MKRIRHDESNYKTTNYDQQFKQLKIKQDEELRPIGNIKTMDVKVRSKSHYQAAYKDQNEFEMEVDKDINKRFKEKKRRDLKLSYNLPFSCSTEHKDAYLG